MKSYSKIVREIAKKIFALPKVSRKEKALGTLTGRKIGLKKSI